MNLIRSSSNHLWGNLVKRTLRSENYVDILQCMSSPTRKADNYQSLMGNNSSPIGEVVGQLFNNSISMHICAPLLIRNLLMQMSLSLV